MQDFVKKVKHQIKQIKAIDAYLMKEIISSFSLPVALTVCILSRNNNLREQLSVDADNILAAIGNMQEPNSSAGKSYILYSSSSSSSSCYRCSTLAATG
jgi:hypothetical protein